MKHIDPFDFYSAQLLDLLKRSEKQKNRALWLYKNDLRTPAFMVQSLCRLFDYGFGDKDFKDGHKLFKKLEDDLGRIDFYDVMYNGFSHNKKIDDKVKKYTLNKRDKEVKKLEKFLNKKGGFEARMKLFNEKISSKVKFDTLTIKKTEKVIGKEIETIKSYERKNFKNIEEVHKLRRELRWISIYGISLCGIITLRDSGKKESWQKIYLTKDVVNLAFNKLPRHPHPHHILFSKNNFYALSWMIQELGKLKDKGLNLKFLTKAIGKTTNLNEESALKKAKSNLGMKESEAEIIKEVSRICAGFFDKNKILNRLIMKSPPTKRK